MASKTNALNEEAAAWWSVMHSEPSAADRDTFSNWLDRPEHAVAYARVEMTWERSERLKAVSNLNALRGQRQQRRHVVDRRAAAAAVLGLGGLALGWSIFASGTKFATALGERRTVTLSDGSIVHLNTGSVVEVDFSTTQRSLSLTGEALFEVAKDTRRPFIVSAGPAIVRAVGTAFNVRLRDNIAEVIVTEGVVAVSEHLRTRKGGRDGQPVSAGNAVMVGPGAVEAVRLDREALQRRTAWRDGVLEFRGETLDQAVEEFNRYRSDKIVIGDPSLASMRVGGTFAVDEGDAFLLALAPLNVKATKTADGTAYLTPGG